jgi:hypothetical protein
MKGRTPIGTTNRQLGSIWRTLLPSLRCEEVPNLNEHFPVENREVTFQLCSVTAAICLRCTQLSGRLDMVFYTEEEIDEHVEMHVAMDRSR